MKRKLACLLATFSIVMLMIVPVISNDADFHDSTFRASFTHEHGLGS